MHSNYPLSLVRSQYQKVNDIINITGSHCIINPQLQCTQERFEEFVCVWYSPLFSFAYSPVYLFLQLSVNEWGRPSSAAFLLPLRFILSAVRSSCTNIQRHDQALHSELQKKKKMDFTPKLSSEFRIIMYMAPL